MASNSPPPPPPPPRSTPAPTVPGASQSEQIRELAEAVADIHKVLGIIVNNPTEFIPGEAIAELEDAWIASSKSLAGVVEELNNKTVLARSGDVLPQDPIVKNELTGDTGKAKRAWLCRLRDWFYARWHSPGPRTEESRADTAEAAVDYLEFSETVLSSLGICHYAEEFVSLVRQLISSFQKRRKHT